MRFKYYSVVFMPLICIAPSISIADTNSQNINSNNWGITSDDFNILRKYDLSKKAGGCERISEFEAAANKNDVIANILSGICYDDGIKVQASTKKARQYYQKAADLNSAEGMGELVDFYLYGFGGPKDKDKAIQYLNNAVSLGSVKAKIKLAHWLIEGKNIAKDEARGMKIFGDLSDSGDRVAQNIYANMLLQGKNGQRNDKLAFELLEKSSSQGEVPATLSLAYTYLSGDIMEKDIEKSTAYFKQAVATNDPYALKFYGLELIKGADGNNKKETGAQMLKQAGEMGLSDARIYYAQYLTTLNDKDKTAQALEILNNEIKNENTQAMNVMSEFYYFGKMLPQDKNKAILLLKKSIEKGNTEALAYLASTLIRNKDDKKSVSEGLEILKAEVEKSNIDAQVFYAKILLNGEIVEKNPVLAEKLLLSAANEFDRNAMFTLGTYYYNKPEKSSKAKGIHWLELGSNYLDNNSMFYYGKILLKEHKTFEEYEKGLDLINKVALTKTINGQKARDILLQIKTGKCRREKNYEECVEI